MEAKVVQFEDIYVVHLKGQLNFESADALKARCSSVFLRRKVIFDLSCLSFVGSSGITPFLELLGELLKINGNTLKVCAVGNEFIRVFEAGGLNGLEVYENEEQARMAFKYPPYAPVATPAPTATCRWPTAPSDSIPGV